MERENRCVEHFKEDTVNEVKPWSNIFHGEVDSGPFTYALLGRKFPSFSLGQLHSASNEPWKEEEINRAIQSSAPYRNSVTCASL